MTYIRSWRPQNPPTGFYELDAISRYGGGYTYYKLRDLGKLLSGPALQETS